MSGKVGNFALVLHTHLPYMLRHGRWPHGTEWLCEAAASCYLPLLDLLERLRGEEVAVRATVSVSPVLAEQLAHPEFRREMEGFLEQRLRACAEDRANFVRAGDAAGVGLADFWKRTFEGAAASFAKGSLLGRFRALADAGAIELITCGATHGYLPLLLRDESVELQVAQAVRTHARHFGKAPRGIWLPECAYRPRYAWTPPAGAGPPRPARVRLGVEEVLAKHALGFFFADSHLVAAGEPLAVYRDFFPTLGRLRGVEERFPSPRRARSPYRPYFAASRGGGGRAAVLVRDPRTTLQVWSREHGYPGDGAYLEFHKRHFPGGHRYWRVTSPRTDLGAKEPYSPARARERAEEHARHFVWLVGEVLSGAKGEISSPPLLVSPYDTELFGHWWFEGPLFLEHVFRHLADSGVEAVTASRALEESPPAEVVALSEGSWGEGGDHRVWLNADTRWIWDRIYDAEDELASLAGLAAGPARDLVQLAGRELLVLQASDWPFLVTTGSARDYAERRFSVHYADFKRLADLARRAAAGERLSPVDATFVEAVEGRDDLFRDLDLAPYLSPR
ncbi:MAG TPA: 1,4-alpha-glucan branching protein domain-containing protein [Planctomycetota bacterium]|jgi:1,4-alpha-glucan branching enzyme|nr:1,4-alpha-glucan branching protein domain-containing protein [Planctomycetota bacterium]